MVCQLGDLVCDCSVIYFPDKRGTVCVAGAASVLKPMTALNTRWMCLLCWPWTLTRQILFFFFFSLVVVLYGGQVATQEDFYKAVLDYKQLGAR